MTDQEDLQKKELILRGEPEPCPPSSIPNHIAEDVIPCNRIKVNFMDKIIELESVTGDLEQTLRVFDYLAMHYFFNYKLLKREVQNEQKKTKGYLG